MLVEEYADGGDLFSHINHDGWFLSAKLPRYFRHVVRTTYSIFRGGFSPAYPQVEAVLYMHRLGLVHRDIKPENIVIGRGDIAKLCDLGMVETVGTPITCGKGTVQYMAPEIVGTKVCL